VKRYFLTGLAILLPLALTTVIVVFLVNFLTRPFLGLVEDLLGPLPLIKNGFWFLSGKQILQYGGRFFILLMLFGFTVLLGVIGRWFLIHSLFKFGDEILHRIPVVNKVYKTSQEVINTLFSDKTQSFKQVVLAPFPNSSSYCLGLLTRESPPACREITNENLVSVFLPTTPNPTSGYLLMFRKSELKYLDMKVEDAVKFIISCGVIYPGSSEPINEEMLNARADLPKSENQ